MIYCPNCGGVIKEIICPYCDIDAISYYEQKDKAIPDNLDIEKLRSNYRKMNDLDENQEDMENTLRGDMY